MKCNICEYENIDNAKYCSRCGNHIKFVEEDRLTLTKKTDNTKDYDKFAKIGIIINLSQIAHFELIRNNFPVKFCKD